MNGYSFWNDQLFRMSCHCDCYSHWSFASFLTANSFLFKSSDNKKYITWIYLKWNAYLLCGMSVKSFSSHRTRTIFLPEIINAFDAIAMKSNSRCDHRRYSWNWSSLYFFFPPHVNSRWCRKLLHYRIEVATQIDIHIEIGNIVCESEWIFSDAIAFVLLLLNIEV